ncbi:hypothetical protein CRE_29027 [Caenorhabditis remanei]|uniref:Uncharacterized protein n=1 Tax=Caenorhabditis remanei TaxID=31234 RepID=E3NA62_CAERE|nr:hypothetical protein CRE_29027 [Caenorhabditis remanei]
MNSKLYTTCRENSKHVNFVFFFYQNLDKIFQTFYSFILNQFPLPISTMKIYQCIGVSLILFVGLNSSSPETEKILNSMNNFRKTFADLTGVKGMSKLKYDRNLQLEASRSSTCYKPDDLKNQSTYFPSDQSVIDEFFEVFNQTKSDEIKKKFGFDNVLNPGFTNIGCYHYKKQCSETVMYSTEYFTKMRVVDTKGRVYIEFSLLESPLELRRNKQFKVLPKCISVEFETVGNFSFKLFSYSE